ncbi:MAG: hypothetical protein ACKO3N_17645 [Verrucomicrobiota bacterium]
MNLTFCLAEDRAGAEIGLKLAILSLRRHCGQVPVVLYRPAPLPSLVRWLRGQPQVRLVTERLPGWRQWDCKPQALLPLLEQDPAGQVVWLDSDLMLAGDPRPLYDRMSPETVGITQEPPSQPHQGSELRTRGWELPVGRCLPHTLNSCMVRFTACHRPLLVRWDALLRDPRYVALAAMNVQERPPAMMSDQDVLNALLGSREFSGVPLAVFRNGREVLHSGGALAYSATERVRGLLLRKPVFLHAISLKPWMVLGHPELRGRWGWRRKLQQEISPFVAEARAYAGQVDEPCPWLEDHTLPGRLLRLAGLGHWALRGLPVSVLAAGLRRGGWA